MKETKKNIQIQFYSSEYNIKPFYVAATVDQVLVECKRFNNDNCDEILSELDSAAKVQDKAHKDLNEAWSSFVRAKRRFVKSSHKLSLIGAVYDRLIAGQELKESAVENQNRAIRMRNRVVDIHNNAQSDRFLKEEEENLIFDKPGGVKV
jgi:hypothetical protein